MFPCTSKIPPLPSHSWERESMIITSIPASSHCVIASMYLSGVKGASRVMTLYAPKSAYRSPLPFSVSIRATLSKGAMPEARSSAPYVFPEPETPVSATCIFVFERVALRRVFIGEGGNVKFFFQEDSPLFLQPLFLWIFRFTGLVVLYESFPSFERLFHRREGA